MEGIREAIAARQFSEFRDRFLKSYAKKRVEETP
jgi:queuine/archaeosine tRNA-ribosyltransferase